MKKHSESNRSYLSKSGPRASAIWELLPTTLRDQKFTTVWFPEVGTWYTAEAAGLVGGGRGQDWKDDGILIKAGDKFRVLKRGNPSRPSVWEVASAS